MLKRILVCLISLTVVITMTAQAVIPVFAKDTVLKATKADEWTALFDRRGEKNTWLGADGFYTIPVDGNDSFGSAASGTKTFCIFSDTLMGTANSKGKLTYNAGMPSHTSALLTGNMPSKDAIEFIYGNGGNGTLGQHMFGQRLWLYDGFVSGDALYIFAFPPSGDWKPERADLVKIPIKSNGELNYSRYRIMSNIEQLHYRDENYLYSFGMGVTVNTESAHAVNPDGYVYIYGYRDALNERSRKDLIVARIKESDLTDFSKLTYWNGSEWGTNIEECAVLISSVSCEMSVTYVPVGPYAGKYIAVYVNNTRSSEVMYAIGDSLYGPFDTPVKFYDTPEFGQKDGSGNGELVVYNAKAHLHLSWGDQLLISYNVNTTGNEQYTTDYHPRFVYLDLDPEKEYVREEESVPDENTGEQDTDTENKNENTHTDKEGIPDGKKDNKWVLPTVIAAAAAVAIGGVVGVVAFKKKKKG